MKTITLIASILVAIAVMLLTGQEKATAVGTNNGKIIICHVPPGDPAHRQTIEISQSALAAHLAHGDCIGSCDFRPPGDTTWVPNSGLTNP